MIELAIGLTVENYITNPSPGEKKGGGKISMKEEKIGKVIHYFPHIPAGAIELEGELAVGDTVHIKGHTTDFTQVVESMQIENTSVEKGKPGDDIAIKLKERVRGHDIVYKVLEESESK
jgi:translation elongation factor EF-Tu-like GTPase